MDKIAFFFAGQGAQYSGMGASLTEVSPAAHAVFEAADALRPGTSKQCFGASAEELAQTINTQPCLFVVDLACAAALNEAGITPSMLAGFSLGELAALAYTGMLSFEEAFALVIKRAELMQEAAKQHPGSMAAILRLSATQVEELCEPFEGVYPVNYNAPEQTVVSGTDTALEKLEASVKEAGGRMMKLAVGGSFHSPFMAEASSALRAYLDTTHLAAPVLSLYANATAQPYPSGESASNERADLLARQVKSPVLFQASVENMVQAGARICIELGAGKTLSGLIKKIDSSVKVLNVQDASSLNETLSTLKELGAC